MLLIARSTTYSADSCQCFLGESADVLRSCVRPYIDMIYRMTRSAHSPTSAARHIDDIETEFRSFEFCPSIKLLTQHEASECPAYARSDDQRLVNKRLSSRSRDIDNIITLRAT